MGNPMPDVFLLKMSTSSLPGENRGEILLVDDSPSSLQLLSTLLVESGYLVREATSGELALWSIKSRVPEIILLDLRMPDMDGFAVCRLLKADPSTRSIPVIFLSAQDETTDKVQGLRVGAVDFVTKSAAHEEILARVDTHVTLARVKKALELERALLELRVEERTEQLARGKGLLRSVIDSGPDLIHAIDRQSRYLLVNRNLARALGVASGDDLVGLPAARTPLTIQRPDGPQGSLEIDDQRVFAGESIFIAEEALSLPGGRQGVFETHMTPLRETNGEIYGLLCYRREITSRLRMEEERRHLEKALWQAKKMEAVGQLAGGIAHDFNNLLSLILGFAEFARNALAAGKHEKLDNYIGEITKAGLAGQAVVAQLLAFSRIDEGASEAIDPWPSILEVTESLRPSMGVNIDIALRCDDGCHSQRIKVRPVQLRQILTNLVINARDAIGSQLADGRVTIRAVLDQSTDRVCASCRQKYSGPFWVMSVSDNGSGIPLEIAEKMFDPFFTTKDVGKGSGLGLSMVHGIVHSLGGHLRVESDPGRGTTIHCLFPVLQ